jgi:plasmid stabilization system protein ParE
VTLRWTERAVEELAEIRAFIAQDKPVTADRWIARLRGRARKAAQAPRSGRRVPDLDRDDVREVVLRGYRIVYRLRQDAIDVLTVFDGHRVLRLDLDESQPGRDSTSGG